MQPSRVLLAIASSLVLLGCGDLILPAEPDSGSEEELLDDAGVDGSLDGRVPRADSGTLSVASLSASASTITQGQSIRFTAIVSDTLGVSNIIDGDLLDETGVSYASLTPTSSFSVSATLTWAGINAVRPIQFTPPGAQRTFVARFRNRLGQTASASVQVAFQCAPETRMGACGGVCTDLWSNDHCGQCGSRCTTTCAQGVCR